jgi:hypothetical protein
LTLRISRFTSALLLLATCSSSAAARSIPCCNPATGEWSKASDATACRAKGFMPFDPSNPQAAMSCVGKAPEDAAAAPAGSPGDRPPTAPALPADLAAIRGVMLSGPPLQPDCCSAAAGRFVGPRPAAECLALAGHFPDTPDHLAETEACREPAPAAAFSAEAFADNIPNGGLEIWRDENTPAHFTARGVFRSADAHTGGFSALLQGSDPGAAFRAEAVLPVGAVKPFVCGAYKGFISPRDQLTVSFALNRGGSGAGGADIRANGFSIFTRSSSGWVTFGLPLNLSGAGLAAVGGVILNVQVEPRGPISQPLATGVPSGAGKDTRLWIDSLHFCTPAGTTNRPKLQSGGEVGLKERQEHSREPSKETP